MTRDAIHRRKALDGTVGTRAIETDSAAVRCDSVGASRAADIGPRVLYFDRSRSGDDR